MSQTRDNYVLPGDRRAAGLCSQADNLRVSSSSKRQASLKKTTQVGAENGTVDFRTRTITHAPMRLALRVQS
jgi:hypothetical protein